MLNFFRKIIYHKCKPTASELAENQRKTLHNYLNQPLIRYEQGQIKCPKCGSSKIFPPILDKYICGDCANIFYDPKTGGILQQLDNEQLKHDCDFWDSPEGKKLKKDLNL